jgi:hypothetical protein
MTPRGNAQPGGHSAAYLTIDEQRAVRRYIATVGWNQTLRLLHMGPETLAIAIDGGRVRRDTRDRIIALVQRNAVKEEDHDAGRDERAEADDVG